MKAALPIAVAALLGAGAGAYLALNRIESVPAAPPRELPAAPETRSPPAGPDRGAASVSPSSGALLPPDPSFYFDRIQPAGIDISQMTPTLLTPRASEHIPESCPTRLAVLGADETYAEAILPYLDAAGAFPGGGGDGLSEVVARSINVHLGSLRELARKEPQTPPLRVLIKHYPRPMLPGHCVTVHVSFFTVADPYIDEAILRRAMEGMRRASEGVAGGDIGAMKMPGVLLEVRRTWQLASGTPRLVEVMAEIHADVAMGRRRMAAIHYLPEEGFDPGWEDGDFGAHLMHYGAGERLGMHWIDRAPAPDAIEPRIWAHVYRIRQPSRAVDPRLEWEPLAPSEIDLLFQFVARF